MGIFTKDFECEINRYINNTMKKPKEKSVFALPLGGRDVRHNKDTCSAVQLVECIRVGFCLTVKFFFYHFKFFLGNVFECNRRTSLC